MLLQSTATLITISINTFVNVIQFEISFFIKIYVKVLTKAFYIQIWFNSFMTEAVMKELNVKHRSNFL